MKIVQAANDDLTELMSFYSVMCDVLGEKSFHLCGCEWLRAAIKK